MSFITWLDARTGAPTAIRHLLNEPLPVGTGWLFTLGGILLLLLVVQIVSGIGLAFYYAPTPDHAHDSVTFIISEVVFGRVLRNLHSYGASFLVVVASLHLLRVFVFAAYKPPRELTWMTGVLLLLLLLSFAMSGYLLPWDQRGYWGTVVTINIARSTPLVGELIATVIQGGSQLGALTLARWYAVHVVFLPGILAALVLTHLFLMRRHGISGPFRVRASPPRPFYPDHAIKDAFAIAFVFALLLALSITQDATFESRADPTDAGYVPRPEWYLLGLFQLLKFFPGRWEVIGTVVLPGLLVSLMLALPFFDRHPERWPLRRPLAMAAAALVTMTIVALTAFGLRDVPPSRAGAQVWTLRALGGRELANDLQCARCHGPNGAAESLESIRLTRDEGWIASHVRDPEMIAPDLRKPPRDLSEQEVQAVVSYVQALRTDQPRPDVSARERTVAKVLARYCLACHVIDGDGGDEGPVLSRIGKDRDAEWLAAWIADPVSLEPDTDMPAFGEKLTQAEIRAVAEHLAKRK